jgi:hypothetical protein
MTRSVAVEPRERTEGRKKFFHALFITALEGGIGYWSCAEEYHWSKPENYTKIIDGLPFHGSHQVENLDHFYARISSNENDWGVEAAYQPHSIGAKAHPAFHVSQRMQVIAPDEVLTIDIDVIERGWELFMDAVLEATKAESSVMPCSCKYFRQAIIAYLTDGEEGDYDATVADFVVQFGLFGEVVYA